jgi:hypothetical protein
LAVSGWVMEAKFQDLPQVRLLACQPSQLWPTLPCPRSPLTSPVSLSDSHLQDGHYYLRVFIEAVLPDGRVDVAQAVTLICPKPDHAWTLDPPLIPPTMSSSSTPHTLPLHSTSSHSWTDSGYAFSSALYPEHSFVYPTPSPFLEPGPALSTLPQPQWGMTGHWEATEPYYIGM